MIALLCAGAAFGFATSVFYLLPKFLAATGAPATAIGAATSAFGFATVATAPLIALWIDSVSRVRLIAAGSLLMLAVSAAFVAVDGYGVLLLLLRCAQGCAFACVFTALSALVTELAPQRRLSEALGLAGASMLVMNAIAPAVVEPLAGRYGWPCAFALAAAASAVALFATVAMPPETPLRSGADVAGLARLARRADTVQYALITAAVGAAFGAMFTYPQPFAMEMGRESVRGFFVAYTVFALGARIVLGRLADRVGRFRVAVIALHLYTLVVLAGAGLRPALLEPLGALLGLAHGVFFPAFNAGVIAGLEAADRNKILSVFTGAFYGGLALGALPLGALADAAGYPAVFVATAGVTFGAGMLLVASRTLADPATGPPLSTAEVAAGGVRLERSAPLRPTTGDKEARPVEQSCAI
jgi:predicted MFS family arabinose efflux permease